jgi:hypothetical protein
MRDYFASIKKGERFDCALPLEEEVNEEGFILPSRAKKGDVVETIP